MKTVSAKHPSGWQKLFVSFCFTSGTFFKSRKRKKKKSYVLCFCYTIFFM